MPKTAPEKLGRLQAHRKSGPEHFVSRASPVDFNVLEFWQWSASDLLSNATRGRLAEFIVAKALGISTAGVRNDWDPFDLQTAEGIKIEVKSAAYLQSWHQNAYSLINFSIAETCYWDANTNKMVKERKRHADMYVFALLDHQDKTTVEPMNLDQWRFFAIPTTVINDTFPGKESVKLIEVQGLAGAGLSFHGLKAHFTVLADLIKRMITEPKST